MEQWNPHNYQKEAIKFLLGQAAAGLFLDPGLGKTSTCLAAFKILKDKGIVEKMLVIAPLRPMYSVWPVEVKKWANFYGLTTSIIHGSEKHKRLQEDTDIHIINPEGLKWFFEQKIPRYHYDIMCIDESTKFKNSSSQRFKLLRKHLDRFPRRWILTGTPTPRGIENLFSQIYLLDFGRALGKYITHFRMEFMYQPNPWEKYRWEVKPDAMEKIADRVSPLILRLKAEDYLELPPLIVNDVFVKLDDKSMKNYREVEEEFISLMEEGVVIAENAAAAGTKCRQIANGAVYYEEGCYLPVHDFKIEALKEIIEELDGKPILLLYEYRHDIERIKEAIPETVVLNDLSPKKADEAINNFNQGRIGIMAGHPASMGHGLNMQEHCHHVVFFGLTWDLELYDQVIKRVWRQGQKMPVTLHRILARETLDEKVSKVLIQKEKTQEDILGVFTRPRL